MWWDSPEDDARELRRRVERLERENAAFDRLHAAEIQRRNGMPVQLRLVVGGAPMEPSLVRDDHEEN
jgi:hypothetical protein